MNKTLQKHLPTVAVFGCIAATFFYFTSRYTIAINGAASDCLRASVFLVDKWDQQIRKGDLAAFTMNNENAVHGTGQNWIKKAVATGGMRLNVTENEVVINGKELIKSTLTYSLNYLDLSMKDVPSFVVVPDGEFFMMGETITSYDSRYWGTVKQQDILGKAYALF